MFRNRKLQTSPSLDAQVEIVIPKHVAERLQTLEEFDAFVKREIDRLGTTNVWVEIPGHLGEEVRRESDLRSAAPETGENTVGFTPAGLGSKAVNADMCRGEGDGTSGRGNLYTTRRGALGWMAKRSAAIAVAVGLGTHSPRNAAAASCYNCGSSCYFSSFYGCYVKECYYYYEWYPNCATYCTLRRFYWVSCPGGPACPSSV